MAVRLLEFATVRAMEVQAAASRAAAVPGSGDPDAQQNTASTAAVSAASAGESKQPCKLRMRIAQVKADLIRQREIEVLLPAAGPEASEVLRLLRPVADTGFSMSVPAVAHVPLPATLISTVMATGAVTHAGHSGSATEPGSSGDAIAPLAVKSGPGLMGLSCTIGSSGEVCSAPAYLKY